jgi:lipopolysaccharide transport system ATP-binding protein
MSSDDVAISVHNLTKTYRIFGHPGDRLKQAMTFGLRRYHREFTALRDVSFDVRKGETIGVIGCNGSGKSTLLQLICGILKPTSGTVRVNGRVSALLELGAGFNPEFTGRENVYFHGALMGLTKTQVDQRFDDIAAFADIGEFIDQPVRTYSSGMFVRLAFAAAVHAEPDILVIDEVLAVGDTRFQGQCFRRISEIQASGGSIVLVTHALELVAHYCSRAVLLDRGQFVAEGPATNTLNRYLAYMRPSGAIDSSLPKCKTQKRDAFAEHPSYNPREARWGDGAATIRSVTIVQNQHLNPRILAPCLPLELRLGIRFHADVQVPIFGLTIKSKDGAIVAECNSRQLSNEATVPSQKAGDEIAVCFEFIPVFEPGDYLASVGVVGETAAGLIPHDRRYDSLVLRFAWSWTGEGNAARDFRFWMVA